MSVVLVAFLSAMASWVGWLAITPVYGQNTPAWRLHTTIEGSDKPFLCKDRETVALIVAVEGHAMRAREANEGEKAKRLVEIATQLQGELCRRPVADDIVILRCKLEQQDFFGALVSTVKISAMIRADAFKGEQAFFAWTLAPVDESTDPEAQKASSRWCGDEQTQDEQLSPSADLVLRLQNRFYDFGLHIPQINGQMTAETLQALIEFQKWAGLPPTGQLSKRMLQKIDDTPAPSSWVAIAFDGFSNYGAVRGQTRRGAESDAILKLQQRSRAEYKVAAVASPRCIAFATTRYQQRTGRRRITTYTQAFTGAGDSANAAGQKVLQFCNGQKGGGICQVRDTLCADSDQGERVRFDREDIPVNAPAPRFDRDVPPVNAPPPRFDPSSIPANSPAPNSR